LGKAAPKIRQCAAARRLDGETGVAVGTGEHADTVSRTGSGIRTQGRFRHADGVLDGYHMARFGLVRAKGGETKNPPPLASGGFCERKFVSKSGSVSFPTALANRADGPNEGRRASARMLSFRDGGKKLH